MSTQRTAYPRRAFLQLLGVDAVKAIHAVGEVAQLGGLVDVLVDASTPKSRDGHDGMTDDGPVRLAERHLSIVDRSIRPARRDVRFRHAADVAGALRTMAVRGPATRAIAAFGLALTARMTEGARLDTRTGVLRGAGSLLRRAQPWNGYIVDGVAAIQQLFETSDEPDVAPAQVRAIWDAALNVRTRSIAAETRMISAGAASMPSTAGRCLEVMTLGSTGMMTGRAIAPVAGMLRTRRDLGHDLHVWVLDTNDPLEAAKTTFDDLTDGGIRSTIVTDAGAGAILRHFPIDLVLVESDGTTADGDFVGLPGMYELGAIAARHRVPVWLVAPTALDNDGLAEAHPVDAASVFTFWQTLSTPAGHASWNGRLPPVELMPKSLVTALVTEQGLLPASRMA